MSDDYKLKPSVDTSRLSESEFNAVSQSFRAGRLPHDAVATLANIREVREEEARVQIELSEKQQAQIAALQARINALTNKETT